MVQFHERVDGDDDYDEAFKCLTCDVIMLCQASRVCEKAAA